MYGPLFDHDASAASAAGMPKNSWRELPNRKRLHPVNGADYYEFTLPNGSSAHLVVAYIKGGKWRLRPFLGEKIATTSTVAQEQGASAAVNGGYFNLSDGKSASYVTLDGKVAADPHDNRALMENPKLAAFMTQILNRSEIRILSKTDRSGKKETFDVQIARHNDPLAENCRLVDALQAGPRLLPVLEAEEEAFLRRQADGTTSDSIGCRKPAARTAVGITPDGYLLLLTVADKAHDQESTGLTLAELADLLKHLGCRQAINLDGGSSTSMFVRLDGNEEPPEGRSVCAKRPETLVKTVLMLLPI